VFLTVALTVTLVVVLDGGARGYLAGNYVASAVVLLGLWWLLRARLASRGAAGGRERLRLGPLLAFGVPTVPADATVFALNVVDRAYILRSQSAAAAGLFALSVKLATAVILAVRGFQLAWPPLAYSIGDDREAGRFYAAVATWYVVVTGYVVAGLTLLGRWVVRLLAAPEYFAAHEALPWVALGWAMYGLFLVLVTIGGRAGVTTRTFPAALAGVIVNAIVLVALVGPLGIAGAGIALVAAYAVMLVVLHLLTRGLFAVPFQWRRLTHAVVLLAGVSVAGELLLPAAGLNGFLLRAAAAALIPVLFAATRFAAPEELAALRRLIAARRPRRVLP
jgi:O-antigen/teichoic acid export membrane protein